MLNRHKIPDVVLGALLAVAIFALGFAFKSSRQPPTNEQAASDTKRGGGIVAPEQSGNKLTDWLLVLFSGLLFGSTALLWNANNRSAKIAERALTELEAPFVSIKINAPGLEIKGPNVTFGILQYCVANYGRTPATVLEHFEKVDAVEIGKGLPPKKIVSVTATLPLTSVPVSATL